MMAMLAERKRKTKWIVNPIKKPLWTIDSSGIKFGKDLMEKMGWSPGKGLGINEQGIQEPLRVSYKNDTKGIGFRVNDDDWIEQQDEFNELLNQLRNDSNLSVIKTSEEESVMKSLEEKSKQSKARVHYQKFTRGKDLSRYSDNDLACILGTNKMKRGKSKIEELIETKQEVVENYETSFGVTTISGGSVQDYFKKKWNFNKKSSNSSVMFKDAAKISSENYQKSEFDYQKNEYYLTSGSEEEKFKKKNLKTDFEQYLNINENATFDSDKVESFENSVKSRKRNKELQENNLEEVKVKKVKKDYDSNILAIENMQKNKNHLVNVLKYEESMSLFNETSNYNLKAKRKKEKNQLQVDITEHEKNYGCIAEKERPVNHKNGCITKVPFDEKLNKANVKFTLEEEITKRRKKKKLEKEMLNKIELKEKKYILAAPLKNQNNSKVIEFCLETNSVKKMKKKNNKEKYLENKDFVSKYHNSNESEPFSDHSVRKTEVVNEEEINGISRRNDGLDINIVNKRKKKKSKKEKLVEEESINSHIRSFEKFNLEEDLREKNTNTNEQEKALESQSYKKKKKEKKKDKGEKLDEKEKSNVEFHSDHTEKTVLAKTSKGTNISEVIISVSEQENIMKGESYQQKKKKKHKKEKEKKERETEDIDCYTNHGFKIQVKENTPELKMVKEKRKKEKKEKFYEKEKPEMDYSCDKMEKSVLKEISEKTNISNVNIDSVQDKSFKKKKDGEKPIQNKDKSYKQLFVETHFKEQKQEKIEKTNSKNVDKKIDLNDNNKNHAFRFMINNKIEESSGVHQHKIELLNEKKADKFYPGQYTNDRVLRLLSLSDIAAFKGSNLENVVGYGLLRKCESA